MEKLIITEFAKLDGYRREWDSLLKKNSLNEIFLTYDYLKCWWEHFNKNKKLFCVIIKDKNEVKGIFPLMISTYKILFKKIRIVQFIGYPNADYSDFINGTNYNLGELEILYGTSLLDTHEIIKVRVNTADLKINISNIVNVQVYSGSISYNRNFNTILPLDHDFEISDSSATKGKANEDEIILNLVAIRWIRGGTWKFGWVRYS